MGLKIKQVGSLLSALLHRISPQNAMFCMPNILSMHGLMQYSAKYSNYNLSNQQIAKSIL